MADILVLYYSATGSVRALAQSVARGIESVEGMRARVRTVPKVAPVIDKPAPAVPSEGAPYVEARDLEECAGLALGSPTRFGNMAAPLKHFIDGLGAEVGARHARRKARRGVLVHRDDARRPGSHADLDDGAARCTTEC